MDLILAGGKLVDGTGRPARLADVGIRGERVVAIGDLASAEGQRIDFDGKVISPGFIDIHSHADFFLLVNPEAESAVRQGVTTVVVGTCGHSCAPAPDQELITSHIVGYSPDFGVDISWNSFGEYLDRLEENRPAVNVASLVGHGALRIASMGFAKRPPRADELDRMVRLLEQALDDGAAGMSTGLEYSPDKNATEDEIATLCDVVARRDMFHSTHVRDRNQQYADAIEEAIRISRRSQASLQISHLPPRFWVGQETYARIIEMIEEARDSLDVSTDMMPYTWGMVPAAACIPPWGYDNGKEGLLKLLGDPAARQKMRQYTAYPFWELLSSGQWEKVMLLQSSANRDLVGKTLAEIAGDRRTDAYDAICDLLFEEGDNFYSVMFLTNTFLEEDLAKTAALPYCMFMSDGVILAHYGPLKNVKMQASSYGYAPRSIQVYVRERKQMSLEEAVHRMTELPARKAGLVDRGTLRPGAYADITVFDAEAITDNTTLLEPSRYPSGIELVLVNGTVVFGHDDHTGRRPGSVIRSFA
jgi:N-acyl-D-aspartate/D-glutamate deacylase